jgi:Ca2+-binding EF-hand superfamily protein
MRTALFAAAAILAFAAPAAAQDTDAEETISRARLVETVEANFKRIDSDSDGTVTKAEIAAAQDKMVEEASARAEKKFAEQFAKLDTNKDGMLNLSEFTAAAPDARAKASADSRLDKFDSNQDGKITLDEFKTPVLANFDRIDANKDGELSDQEKRQALAQQGR